MQSIDETRQPRKSSGVPEPTMWITRVLACIRGRSIVAPKSEEPAMKSDGPMSDSELARVLREYREWKSGDPAPGGPEQDRR
jgi:hypothetical protein